MDIENRLLGDSVAVKKCNGRHLQPFKQGHLDGLCGIYAIVNGLRLVLERRLTESKCEQLFDFLTQYAIEEQGVLDLVSEGVGQRQMRQLLAVSLEYLEECVLRRVMPRISITQPWRRKSSQVGVNYIENINKRFNRDRSAAIIGIEHPINHWSVLRAKDANTLHFFDSENLEGTIKGQLKITAEYCSWDQQNIVMPQSVFLLSIVPRSLGAY